MLPVPYSLGFVTRFGQALLLASLASLAVGEVADWQVRGYASQSYINTSDRVNYGGQSADGSFDVRSLGLNLSNDYLLPNTRLAGQATYRDFGVLDDGDLELDFLLLDFALINTFDYQMGVELGRLRTNYLFYISGWDVIHARPFAILPLSIYQEGYRELFYSIDALRLDARFYWRGYWQVELAGGQPSGDAENISDVFRPELRFEIDGDLTSALVSYESPGGLFGAYVSYIKIDMPVTIAPFEQFGLAPRDGSADMAWLTLGAKLNYERFYMVAEARYAEIDTRSALPAIPLVLLPDYLSEISVLEPVNYYVSAGYRLSENWELYTYFGEIWANTNDKKGLRQSEISGAPAHLFFLRTVSAGVRWNATSKLLLGAQWHRTHGTQGLSFTENPNFFAIPEQWDMLNLVLSYRF